MAEIPTVKLQSMAQAWAVFVMQYELPGWELVPHDAKADALAMPDPRDGSVILAASVRVRPVKAEG